MCIRDRPAEFYAQLTAEVRVLQKTASGEQYRWVKRQPRNEVLDCTVYALFAAHVLDLHRYTEKMWAKLESAVCPPIADMFGMPVLPAIVAEAVATEQPAAEQEVVKVIAVDSPPPKKRARRLA